MAITPIGEDVLGGLLDGSLRVIVSNRALPDSEVQIVGAALALHSDDGAVQIRTVQDLSLAPGETDVVDEDRPTAAAVIGVEAVLRILRRQQRILVDVYAKVEAPASESLARVEVGVVSINGELRPEETEIPGNPDLAVFGRTDG